MKPLAEMTAADLEKMRDAAILGLGDPTFSDEAKAECRAMLDEIAAESRVLPPIVWRQPKRSKRRS